MRFIANVIHISPIKLRIGCHSGKIDNCRAGNNVSTIISRGSHYQLFNFIKSLCTGIVDTLNVTNSFIVFLSFVTFSNNVPINTIVIVSYNFKYQFLTLNNFF